MWNLRNRNFRQMRTIVATIVLFILIGALVWREYPIKETLLNSNVSKEAIAGIQVHLSLKKVYVCGVEEEETVNKTVSSTDDVFKTYHGWELISHNGNSFTFKKNIQDLSPICKEKGYFGLSDQGVLTLFEGPPADHKVIQTFFQINTKKLESSLPDKEIEFLHHGIRIKDIAEYNSILSTYEEYAEWANRFPHNNHSEE